MTPEDPTIEMQPASDDREADILNRVRQLLEAGASPAFREKLEDLLTQEWPSREAA
jgi:hypothetical protein